MASASDVVSSIHQYLVKGNIGNNFLVESNFSEDWMTEIYAALNNRQFEQIDGTRRTPKYPEVPEYQSTKGYSKYQVFVFGMLWIYVSHNINGSSEEAKCFEEPTKCFPFMLSFQPKYIGCPADDANFVKFFDF